MALWRRFSAGLSLAVALGCASRAAEPRGDAAAQREDLAAFEREFFDVDRSFSPAARAEAGRRIAELRAHPGATSDIRFLLTLAQIVALADNGHTALFNGAMLPGTGRVGIRLTPFGDDFFVVRATSAHAALLGCSLSAIDEVPMTRLREAARTLRGGTAAWRDRWAPLLFERPAQLAALGLTRSASGATYRFMCAGTSREMRLTPEPGLSGAGSEMNEVFDGSDRSPGWTPLLTEGRAPWALRDFTAPFRREDAPALDALIIQLRANIDRDGQSIAEFLESSDAERRRRGRANVILDMRFNGGGNLQLTHEFMTSLPNRLGPSGRIVVLTSPWTFSAAIASVGYLKQAGRDRVVLVGEAPGDRLEFWAEGQPIRLPRSGVVILPATERHDYRDGCRRFTDCHQYMRRFPIAIESLAPDVPAPWTIDAYAAGRDPGMDAAARVLARRSP